MDKRLPKTAISLVLVHQELVAQDIALTLHDRYGPDAVSIARSVDEALALVLEATDVHAAVIESGPDEVEGSTLEGEILARGGRIVLMGKLAEAAAGRSRWPVLDRPFADQTLIEMLSSPPAPGPQDQIDQA